MELNIHYIDPEAILGRYAELIAIHAVRGEGTAEVNNPFQQELWAIEGVAQ